MGNPSAPVAALEALGTRMQALLHAASAGKKEVHTTCMLAPEDFAFWNAVAPEIMQDVGVFVATLDASPEQALVRMRGIIDMALASDNIASGSSGVLRVAVAAFHGHKIAKRWDVLQQTSLVLVDGAFEGIQQLLAGDQAEEVLLVLLEFYASILLGFQHSSELLVRARPQLELLAPLVAALDLEQLTRCFLVMATSLAHCHRACEVECAAVLKALTDAFGADRAHRPIAECEAALRSAAWIVPAAISNRYLATVEGKWVMDEFSNEQHASAATAPANAGSISLKKAANVVAHDFRATVQDPRKKLQLQLDGALFRPLNTDGEATTNWQLEGHWCQLLGAAAASPEEFKPLPDDLWADLATLSPWACATCTLSNEGMATKCATCGAAAPANTTSQTTTGGAKTSNPAPLQAVYDAERTFMRVRWSRGEQSGVWLAKKDDFSNKFDLAQSVRAATSNAMVDSNVIPSFAYSPRGDASRVLLLEKTYALSTYGEIAYELWIRTDACANDQPKQTILSAGEFELALESSTGSLVWTVGVGMHVITTTTSVADGKFHHVALTIGKQQLQILVDGVVAGLVDRGSAADQNSIPSRRSTWLSIGGALSDDGLQMESPFHGVLLDLRVWSDLNARSLFSPADALSGSESGLIGYFPLVGDSYRLLVDASKHDNHATAFASVLAASTVHQPSSALSCSCVPVEGLPVTKTFSASVLDFELSGGAAYGSSESPTLRLEHPSAVWHKSSIAVEHGFRSVVHLERADPLMSSHASQVVVALCEASYWDVSTLIDEASSLGLPYDADLNAHRYGGSALFVALEHAPSTAPSVAVASLAVYVWKGRRAFQLCRLANLPLGCDSKLGLAIVYTRSKHLLSIEVLGSGVVADVAVDIESALGIESTRVRTGVIVTSPVLQSNEAVSRVPYSSLLTAWNFESIEQSEQNTSIFHSIYPSLQSANNAQATGGGNESCDGAYVATITCTRSSSDGSAIEQATYGCQTCGVVHGAGLCRVCAVICHEGHELVYMGSMITACACAMRAVGNCKCASPVAASQYPTAGKSAPKVAQWYCNRCTVVNSVHARTCTVCSNTAPENSILGVGMASVESAGATESTSRALVPVSPVVAPTPREWPCPACTYLNAADATKCVICDSAAPSAEPKSEKDGLITLFQAAENHGSHATTPIATPALSSWYCSACTMENKASDNSCFICQTARAVPIAEPVTSPDMQVDLPAMAAPEATLVTVPMETDSSDPPLAVLACDSTLLDSTTQLAQFQLQRATASLDPNEPQTNEVWDSTAGTLSVSINARAFVGQYVEGEYAEKDGFLRGLARLSADENHPRWKFDGRFKKLSQSQENAVSLTWERDMTRFNGKWFRGDGSGEWKCVAAPLVNDFRGLTLVDPTKPSSELQPFYSGMINMKQNLTNVCYQNSFLQSLFLTRAFRQLILSSKVEDYAHLPAEGGEVCQGDVLKAIQDLFARLAVSQRPEIDSHALQRCLPSTFQAGRQQDTSDFAHFLIDSLSQHLSQHEQTAHGVDDVFGGTQATILACKTCGKKSVNREYFWELLLNMIDLRYTPITSITAVSGVSSEIATPTGYERINNDLNKDRTGVPYVYLCVKRMHETSGPATAICDEPSELPITDLVVKVVGFADVKPVLEGYERVELDLNSGGSTVVVGGKKQVYLFFRREPNGSPITDLQIVYGGESVPDGFKQIRVDLNQGDATKVFLCYRCDMPITDMKIVNSGIPGYRMVDHVLNRSNDDTVKQYLAFKVGGSEPCITDLQLVPSADEAAYHEQGWETLGSPSSTYENGEPPQLLLVRRGHGNPIFAVDVFRAPRQVPRYNDYEVIDLYGASDLAAAAASDSIGSQLKGDWLAGEEVDRKRKSVRIHSVSEPIPEALVIKGSCDDKGEVSAVATATSSSWSTVDASSATPSKRVLRVSGYWKNSKVKQAQLFDVELRPGVVGESGSSVYTLSGTIGDGKGRPVAVTGTQTSQNVRIKWPISQLFVLRGDERVPEGAEVVRETCSGKTGNLLAQTQSPHTLYLAVKREETPRENYIGDICVIYGEIDAVPENYTCVEATPSGHSANLNDGTSGVPIFICYRRVSSATEKCLMDLALMWTSGAQADTLPTGFTKIQHTPLGMEANLNQGTTGVSIHLCFAKSDPSDVVKPVDDPLNGEYELTIASTGGGSLMPAVQPLIGKFIRLAVAERTETAYTLEGKFGTVVHGHLPGMVRGTLYTSTQRKKRVVTGVWMLDEQNASSMIDFVPPSYPFEWTLNDACNEVDGWWSGADDAASAPTATTGTPPSSTSSTSSSATPPANSWKLMKDAYVRIAFKKDYGTEWKQGQLVSSERVWRHDVQSLLSRFVASRTLGGDNLLSCSQCNRKTESRTNTVIVAPPAHLILTLKRMFYDWAQQKTRKCLHDVTFPALLTLPSLTSEDEMAVYVEEAKSESGVESQLQQQQHRHRQYGLYGVLVHSGLTANSGHYFSYCRESDDSTQQLHLDDSPMAPWIKFNDSKVQRSSWAEINRAVSSSVSDTVYLLLYKRLSYVAPVKDEEEQMATTVSPTCDETSAMEVEQTDDEDEAMLLAKAMALSMSAAEQKKAEEADAKAAAGAQLDEETKTEEKQQEEAYGAEMPTVQPLGHPIDRVVFQEVEAANTQFLFDTMRTSASGVHVQDLHDIVALRYGLQTNNRQ